MRRPGGLTRSPPPRRLDGASAMSKSQFWILNSVAGVCALLMLANILVGQSNRRSAASVAALRTELNHAQQVQVTAQNLMTRVARAGQTNALLRQLLDQHGINVSLGGAGPAAARQP